MSSGRTGFAGNPTKICSWLFAGWLFLAVSADAIATPYYADVTLPDPHSRFVQSLYAQPVQADFTDDTQLLLLQQEFAQIRYTADADALLDFIGRKVMAAVGFRNDTSFAGIALFGGLLLNLAILGAVMLWRRPPRGENP